MTSTQFDEIDLAGITLFADLTPSELESVYHAFEENHAEKGDRIIREGFLGSGFYVILDGSAAWTVAGKHVDRSATVVGMPAKPLTLRRGDWFGELSLLSGETATTEVVALTSLHTLVLPGEELKDFLLRWPKVMFRLLQGEARRLRDPERWR